MKEQEAHQIIYTSSTWRPIRKARIPGFFDQTALVIFFAHYGFDRLEPFVWELLVATGFYVFFSKMLQKYGFATGGLLRFFTVFSQTMLKKYSFATGRTAMLFLIWPFFGITGENNILPNKNWWLRHFLKMTRFFCFLAFHVVNTQLLNYNQLAYQSTCLLAEWLAIINTPIKTMDTIDTVSDTKRIQCSPQLREPYCEEARGVLILMRSLWNILKPVPSSLAKPLYNANLDNFEELGKQNGDGAGHDIKPFDHDNAVRACCFDRNSPVAIRST